MSAPRETITTERKTAALHAATAMGAHGVYCQFVSVASPLLPNSPARHAPVYSYGTPAHGAPSLTGNRRFDDASRPHHGASLLLVHPTVNATSLLAAVPVPDDPPVLFRSLATAPPLAPASSPTAVAPPAPV